MRWLCLKFLGGSNFRGQHVMYLTVTLVLFQTWFKRDPCVNSLVSLPPQVGSIHCHVCSKSLLVLTLWSIAVRYPPHAGMYSEELLLRAWQLRSCSNTRPVGSNIVLLIDWLALEHNIIHSRCRNVDMWVTESIFSPTSLWSWHFTFIFSAIMDSFESLSTVTFIQVDYDPAVIPSTWTVFSAGIVCIRIIVLTILHLISSRRRIQWEARRRSPVEWAI